MIKRDSKNKILICTLLFFSVLKLHAEETIQEKRANLQNQSHAITQNFNEWQAVRNYIVELKNQIQTHRQHLKECLYKLNASFDENLFQKCTDENYSFSYQLAMMPRSSTALKFPKADLSGDQIARGTVDLVLKLHKWIDAGKQDVKDFEKATHVLYKNFAYKRLSNQLDAAMKAGTQKGYCVPMAVDNFALETTGINARMANQQFFGDIVGITLALSDMTDVQNQIKKAIEFCGDLQKNEFLEIKAKIDKSVANIQSKLSVPLVERLNRFCTKMAMYQDSEVDKLCKENCPDNQCNTSPSLAVLNTMHALTVKNISKGVEKK